MCPDVVLGVFKSADKRARVEVVRERGRQLYRAWVGGFRHGDCADLAALERVLRARGVEFADLIED